MLMWRVRRIPWDYPGVVEPPILAGKAVEPAGFSPAQRILARFYRPVILRAVIHPEHLFRQWRLPIQQVKALHPLQLHLWPPL